MKMNFGYLVLAAVSVAALCHPWLTAIVYGFWGGLLMAGMINGMSPVLVVRILANTIDKRLRTWYR